MESGIAAKVTAMRNRFTYPRPGHFERSGEGTALHHGKHELQHTGEAGVVDDLAAYVRPLALTPANRSVM